MFGILKALIRIAKEVKRIREILEIAYEDVIERYNYVQQYSKKSWKDSEKEFIVKESPDTDIYGDEIKDETD